MPTLGGMVAWLQRNPAWADALAGAVAAVVLVAITALGFRDQGVDAIAYPCCAGAGLAFAVRRRWPVVTFALVIAALLVQQTEAVEHIAALHAQLDGALILLDRGG